MKFDYIINVPLSPDKKTDGELDRVDLVCEILSQVLNVSYAKNVLVLTQPISRRDYKRRGLNYRFATDYFNFLHWRTSYSLDNKNILIVDDVITDGKTLKTIAKKALNRYPHARLYAATCGLMAKMRNMTSRAIKKRRAR